MQITPFALFVYVMGFAALLMLPVATYIAGRWTGQRWLFAVGLVIAVAQTLLGFISRPLVEGALDGGWIRGNLTIGEFVAVLSLVQSFVYAAAVGGLILLVAHAARGNS